MPSCQFELLLSIISSDFSLTDHFDLPDLESISDISQDSPTCVHSSLSQDGFYQKGIWVELALASFPF